MFFEQSQCEGLQCFRGGRHLGQDIYAVLVLLYHALQTAYLAFDPAEPVEVRVPVLGVARHCAVLSRPLSHTPAGYQYTPR
jgi:hypothetical protein